MKALDQKFILLLRVDPFFKKEVGLMDIRWDIHGKNKELFSTAKDDRDLPLEYKKDIDFILMQAILPERYLWSLHRHLVTKEIPKINDLPKPVRTFLQWSPLRNMGKRILEADIDASEKEIKEALREFTDSKKLLQMANPVPKISQPIRDFEEKIKITEDKDNLFEIVEYVAMSGKGNKVKTRNRLEQKRYRTQKSFPKNKRLSVEDREKLEEFYRKNSPDF